MPRILLLLFCLSYAVGGGAQVQALFREAENYERIYGEGPREWRVVRDDSMAAMASGGAYLAVLPDTRVTHADALIVGENFSPAAGRIALVDYSVDIPRPGRYYVWVSAFSRGTEDNGIHVGLDGSWPESGHRMQWCSGKHRWTWESKQRTEEHHCGEAARIYLDIDRAGTHTVTFSMREDGFRMDRWALTPTYAAPTPLPESREDILSAYVEQVYGDLPADGAVTVDATPRTAAIPVFDGLGFRRQFTLHLRSAAQNKSREVDLLLYYPAKASEVPVPIVLNLNFRGNQAIAADTDLDLPPDSYYADHPPEVRGERQRRLPVEMLLRAGLAVVTAGYQDFLPDEDEAARSLMRDFYGMDPAESGAISVWAWAYGRLADWALTQEEIAVDSLVAVGHSRLGKAVLWAAANDERIRAVHVNDSGCGGAALFHRMQGETIADITGNFPHWFRDSFHTYAGRDSLLPLDQHWLLAAVAPRPVLVSSAEGDAWADPRGEFLALQRALPAFQGYDATSDLPESWPEPEDGLPKGAGLVGYHLRTGKHDLIAADWEAFLRLLRR